MVTFKIKYSQTCIQWSLLRKTENHSIRKVTACQRSVDLSVPVSHDLHIAITGRYFIEKNGGHFVCCGVFFNDLQLIS